MQKKSALLVLITLLLVSSMLFYSYRLEISDYLGYSRAALSNYGSTGQEVINIQAKLYNWGYYKGIVDGIYGYETYSAVKYFQAKNGLAVDGVCGPQTLAALGLPTGAAAPSGGGGGGASDSEVNLLAHLIHGEARGEPYIGKVAVGAVVINRTMDSRFPKTIAGVIYQPGAFDAVYDGQINLEPDTSSYNAARDALNGWDPTYGCIYYYNPATATSSWIWSRPIMLSIGKHNFAK
jgi:N-acetylmuramoyl-L-alanine amidase